jgi:predicted RNA-binding protein (TIGR00451 family)
MELMKRPSDSQRRKLIGVGNYQFGKRVGNALFNRKLMIECSRKTGRIRHVYRQGELVATLRPKDGFLALTPVGASIILARIPDAPNIVVIDVSVADAIRSGGDVFARHVVRADRNLRPGEEAIVTTEDGTLLGVGSAVLSGCEMAVFKRGVAVNLRKGVDEPSRGGTDTSLSRAVTQ